MFDTWTQQTFTLLAELTEMLCHVYPFAHVHTCICHTHFIHFLDEIFCSVVPLLKIPHFSHPVKSKPTNPTLTQRGLQIARDP